MFTIKINKRVITLFYYLRTVDLSWELLLCLKVYRMGTCVEFNTNGNDMPQKCYETISVSVRQR